MGTNTGLGIGIGIPFKNNALGGDKPYFPPELKARMIGVWTNYGKKNTDADRNIIKNKIPNAGGDLEILNAAYKLNSGFGKYSEDFTTWTKSSKITSVDSESFDFVTNVNWNLLYYKSNIGKDIPSFKVHIKLKGEGKVFYNYITSEGVFTNKIITSEEYVVPISYNTKYTGETPVNCGFSIAITSEECSGTITQIPNFEDAFVTDGINDMIISQKTLQEMGVTKELTIVSMIHQISWRSSTSVPLTNYIRNGDTFIRNSISNIGKTGIYGYTCFNIKNVNSSASKVINNILGDKNDYIVEYRGDILSERFSVQGYIDANGNILETSSVAHYWTFAVLGKATEDEINLIIGNYNLDRSLKPDILCNIGKQGITNDNHAEFNDKLIDYSGNGRDIQMNNLAWKGGSGIAAKPFETIKDYTIIPNEPRQKLTIYNEFSYKIKSNTPSYYWIVQSIIRDNTSYQVTIITDKDCYWINATSFINSEGNKENIRKKYPVLANTPTQVIICGLDQFEYPEGTKPINAVSYVNLEYAGEITITFIPSHKGGLLLDGVNDFGKVTGMPVYKDYTVIADYERFYLEPITGGRASILSKSSKVGDGSFIFNLEDQDGGKACYTFGEANGNISDDITRIIRYQSKYYNTKTLSIGTAEDNDFMVLGKVREVDSRYFCGAIYSLMTFPYSMSEFLIERQLKKHKLGTLYPDMVEFRPIVKSNNKWDIIEIWQGDKLLYKPSVNDDKTGIYLKKDSTIGIYVKPYVGQKVSEIVYNGVSYTDLKLNSNGFYHKVVPITKSPQKIGITIEQDENYVLFNPVINSNYDNYKLTFHLRDEKLINIGDYIPKGTYIRANLYLKNNIDELVTFTFNGVNIDYAKSPVLDTAYNIRQIYNYDSPQEVNITIDEYIRYEDIVQPYPVIFQITDRNTNQRYSWGDKIKVRSSIRLSQGEKPNLLSGLYSIKSYEYEGETYSYNQLTNLNIILTKQSISLSCNKTWLLDDNEPKCILSPRLLSIPNSSYKLLGYIPDISGHGNHGIIHNSAYAEGSGVNEDGSYQFDGVDDFVTIPTTVGGKQMLMKVNWNSLNHVLYDQRNNAEAPFCIVAASRAIAYNQRNVGGNTYIDGILNNHILVDDLQAITHNIVLNNDYNVANSNSFIGTNYTKSIYAKMSLYDFMLFDEISTDDKIKELNEYVGIEAKVELPPYYWDTYGKTNLDADKATIQQRGVAVGDYDLTNYNHAYEGMSGYNGYPVVFGANKTWEILSSVYSYISDVTSTTIHVTMVKNAGTGLLFSYVKKDEALTNIKEIPAFRVTIKGLEGNSKFGYRYLATEDATGETLVYLGNGTHELAKSFAPTEALLDLTRNAWVGIFITPMVEGEVVFDCDITIEVLPEYENGLAYDSVEDFSDNKNVPIIDDFTVIAKRTWLEENTSDKPFIIKGDTLYSDGNKNAFLFEYGKLSTYSFGQNNKYDESVVPSLISWATPTSYNGTTSLVRGSAIDTVGIDIAHATKIVLYKLILYPKTIPLLQINFLKNLMEKDEIIDLTNPIFIKNE